MSEIESTYDPHGSALPENQLLDSTAAHDLLNATAGVEESLDAVVKGAEAASNAKLNSLKAPQSGGSSGAEQLKRGRQSPVLYDPDRQLFAVGDKVFEEGDFQSAVESESALSDPNIRARKPDGGNWRSIPVGNFAGYINRIKNPTKGELLKRNFSMGTEQLKSLGGSALAAFGAEELGQGIADEADRKAGFYAPFTREFTDIENGGDAADWFVAVLGSQGPQLLESVAVSLAGAAIGTGTAGPGVGTVGGFFAGMFGKKEFKKQVIAASKRYRKAQAKGAAPDADDVLLLKQAGKIAGATVANVASGYTMGVGDIHGEAVDEGLEGGEARVKALFGAIPYAGLEALPEVVAAARLFGAPARAAARDLPEGASKLRKGVRKVADSKAADIAGGAAKIGGLEGVTEAGQESLLMGLTGQDLTSPAAIHRLINAAAAGVAVGSTIGGFTSLRGREKPAEELSPTIPETELWDALKGKGVDTSEENQPGILDQFSDEEVASGQFARSAVDSFAAAGPETATTLTVEDLWTTLGQSGIDVTTDEQQNAILDQFTEEEVTSGNFPAEKVRALMERGGEAQPIQGPAPFTPPVPEVTEGTDADLDEFDALVAAEIAKDTTPVVAAGSAPLQTEAEFEAEFAAPTTPVVAATDSLPVDQPVVEPAGKTKLSKGKAKAEPKVNKLKVKAKEPVIDAAEAEWKSRRKEGGRDKVWAKLSDEEKSQWSAAVADENKADSLDATFRKMSGKGKGRPISLTPYTFDTKEEAEASAEQLELKGTHVHDDGTHMPGESHEVLTAALAERKASGKKPIAKAKPAAKAEPKAEPAPAVSKEDASIFFGFMKQMSEMFATQTEAIKELQAQAKAPAKPEVVVKAETPVKKKLKVKTTPRVEPEPKASPKAAKSKKPTEVTGDKVAETLDQFDDNKAADAIDDMSNSELLTEMWLAKDDSHKAMLYELALRALETKHASAAVRSDAYTLLTDPAQVTQDRDWVDTVRDIIISRQSIAEGSNIAKLIDAHPEFTKLNAWFRPRKVAKKGGDGGADVSPTKQSLMSWILRYHKSTAKVDGDTLSDRRDTWEPVYAEVVEAGEQDTIINSDDANPDNHVKLSEYFNEDGSLRVNGRNQPSTNKKSRTEQREETSALEDADSKAKAREDSKSIYERIDDERAAGATDADIIRDLPKNSRFNRVQVIRALGVEERDSAASSESLDTRIDDDPDAEYYDDYDVAEDDILSAYDDDGTGQYKLVDENTPVKRMKLGQVKLAAQSFISSLRMKPTFVFVRNAEDLKAKNPKLYNAINKARVKGDLGHAKAAGISFDNTVVIFSDNIVSKQDLNFVLAHETLGHYGFRAMIPANVLNSALDVAYNSSTAIQKDVVARIAAAKSQNITMSQREAVEEYIADMAGTIETNVLKQFWYAIKDAFTKVFGYEFQDDMVRYLVTQSRRYVKNGKMAPVDVLRSKIARKAVAIETMTDPENTAYYSASRPPHDDRNAAASGGIPNLLSSGGLNVLGEKSLAQITNGKDVLDRLKKQLTPMNYTALENEGYNAFYHHMRDMGQRVNELRTDYNLKMKILLTPRSELASKFGFDEGISKAELLKVNNLLARTTMAKMGTIDDIELRKHKLMKFNKDGSIDIDADVAKTLSDMGRLTLEDIRGGWSYTRSEAKAIDAEGTKQIEANRKKALADEKDPAKIASINADFDAQLEDGIWYKKTVVEVPADTSVTEDSLVWKGYNAAYDTANAADIDLLKANIASFFAQQKSGHLQVAETLGRDLTINDKEFLRLVSARYAELQDSDVETGNDDAHQFMEAFNTILIGNDTDRVKSFVGDWFATGQQRMADGIVDIRSGSILPGIKEKNLKFSIQHIIQTEGALNTSVTGADAFAKSSIANGHMPLGREGNHQVYIHAKDPDTHQTYRVHESFRRQLTYMRTETKSEAERLAKELTKTLDVNEDATVDKGKTLFNMLVEVPVKNSDGAIQMQYQLKMVELVPQAEIAEEHMADPMGANLNEVVATLSRFSINIHPQARARLIKGLTDQNSRAREKLQRVGVPGFDGDPDSPSQDKDMDMISHLSKKLEAIASTVSRKEKREAIATLMDPANTASRELWYGSQEKYDQLKERWEKARDDSSVPEPIKNLRRREFREYHFTYEKNDSQTSAKRYRDMASRDMAFLDAQTSVEFSDFASGDLASKVRMYTTFAQLGGSVATGVLNILALQTNVVPVLASYNEKTAFGGGFGFARAQTELMHAMNQVKNPAQATPEYWTAMLEPETNTPAQNEKAKAARDAAGFTKAEAEFMAAEVKEGTMAAALMNALLGSARGKITSGTSQKLTQGWMSMFSYTEQASRRGTGLTAFRLAYERGKQEHMAEHGYTDESQINENARAEIAGKAKEFATDMIDQTLGEYAMFNRPAAFRGGVQQFVFMYKMFPLVSIMLLSQMPLAGRMAFLGTLMLMGGIKGLPFADDLMDLLDTIAQGLGMGPRGLWKGTAEKTIAEGLHSVSPEFTPELLRGFVNVHFGINLSDRVSTSNLIPGTGIALAGSDVGRELMEIAGPAGSMIGGTLKMGGHLAQYAAEAVGIKDDTTTLTKIMRESPITMLRALGDITAYHQAGAIVNSKGSVVSNELTGWTLMNRALGFYPAPATAENDAVRVVKRMADYKKQITMSYRARYLAAKMTGNDEEASRVVDMVNSWNESARGTGMEIDNFSRNSRRALREAKKTTTDRFRGTLPNVSKSELDKIASMYLGE